MPRPLRLAPLLLTCAFLTAGCAEEPTAVDVYRVRGVVKALPEAGNPVSSFMVHHEAIPTFIGHDGASDPMPEKTMGFPTAAGVSLDGLEIGDKVELRFEVKRGVGYQATDILPLAGDLELNLTAVDVYRVRGVVKALPEAGNPVSSFMVHHEAIPTFIGHDGASAPMPEMTMGFPTAAGVSLDGLEIGDKIELRFEVKRGVGYQATDILPLAGDLELNLNQDPPAHDHAEHTPAGHNTH